MRETTYSDQLNEILSTSQFESRSVQIDDLTIKTEKVINVNLHHLLKQRKINEKT